MKGKFFETAVFCLVITMSGVFCSWMACYLSTIREENYATRQYLELNDLFSLGALFSVLCFMMRVCSWDKPN